MYREYLRKLLKPPEDFIVKIFVRLRISPNLISFISLIFAIASGFAVIFDFFLYASLLLLFSGLFDLLDGSLARFTGKASWFGEVFDSICDRLGESFVFSSILIYGCLEYTNSSKLVLFVITVLIALISSQLVSYLRAKAAIRTSKIVTGGLMTRFERIIVLVLGFALHQEWIAVGIIAVFSTITVIQRFYLTVKATSTD